MEPLRIIPLGGCGEIGLNCTVIEMGSDMIMIDSGLMFPEDTMPGIDLVIPDISYVKKNASRLKGLILTHGHEDHIGALPYILPQLGDDFPIYGGQMALELIKAKLNEFNIDVKDRMKLIKPGRVVKIGGFEIEFIRVSHSIVDGVGLAIKTPVGVVVHTGDFKLDQTPVDGEFMDLASFARWGSHGVLLLMSDSTNIENEGYTLSEKEVGRAFEEIMRKAKGRVFIASFASNILRIRQAMEVAQSLGRKVIVDGRSMTNNVQIARDLGYLPVRDDLLVDLKALKSLKPEEVCMITTGSQGEPMSALTRMAMDDHKKVKIVPGDTVILSSKFIPGNEKAIANVINHLYRRGADVFYEKVSEIHVSGHASVEELKLMINLVNPKYFMPIHGEYRHLVKHAQLAVDTRVEPDNAIIVEDGDVLEFDNDSAPCISEHVECGRVFIDGTGVGDVGDVVLRDRKRLANDGILVTIIVIDSKTGETVYGPDIFSRGFVFEDESQSLLKEAKEVAEKTLAELTPEVRSDIMEVKEEIRRALRRFCNKKLKRRPVVVPLIIEI